MQLAPQISEAHGAKSSPERPVRVASYNIRKCLGIDRRRDPARIMRVIAGLGADIVALQEADHRLGARPAALPAHMARDHGYEPLAVGESHSLGWHGNAILIRRGIGLLRVERLHLPGLEPRGAVLAELAPGPVPLRLVALHLGLRAADRRRQIAAIDRWLAGRAPMATVVAGDFNEWGPGHWPGLTLLAPGPSFHARLRLAALDRIGFCDRLQPQAMGLVETGEAARASDHLPIWADFRPRDTAG
ncbi:MAG: endonuclease/exonuclease/phosphatase family protein [Paracoccaceae bacterium]